MVLDAVKNPNSKYRPIPFWSWNDKLDTAETRRQVKLMHEAGIGGFFMHARGGLQTPYMGEEWFENVSAAIDEAHKLGMNPWLYDENGWPSGFGDGKINGLGKDYQQKYLRMEDGEKQTDTTICNIDGKHLFYEINPHYVDNLDRNVVKEFINTVYEPYYARFGNTVAGVFTDEPQLSRKGIPWSLVIPFEYEKEYGESILPKLNQLFENTGDYENTRMRFWRLITKLFSESYLKQIYDWCEERGWLLTGHMLLEESLLSQITGNGAVMPNYEYFHIPGVDWLGRPTGNSILPLQLSSVAHQLGKKQILTESFALCGHNVSFSELRKIFEWQSVRGINLLCQHLEGYTLRGIRKRDYPPSLFYQQPWWEMYSEFTTALTRIGMLMAEGEVSFDTLLIHPMSTGWICYDDGENEGNNEYNDAFVKTIEEIERKQIPLHLGDEIIIERHGYVEGNLFCIGTQKYSTVVLPPHKVLFENTKALLEKFKENGGKVIVAEELMANKISDNYELTYTTRHFPEFELHYFVNETDKIQTAQIYKGNAQLDIMTGEVISFSGKCVLNPTESIIVLETKEKRAENIKKENKTINISSENWKIEKCSDNSLVLDYCDLYVDGKLIRENIHINSVQGIACSYEKKVKVKCVFKVNVEYVPDKIDLICETPEIFEFKINGNSYNFEDNGFFRDSSFRRSNISKNLITGENIIELTSDFVQSERVYNDLSLVNESETILNKLSYDMEIEAIYLAGDFSVKAEDEFVISNSVKEVSLLNIEQQGFPFFAGEIVLSKEFEINDASLLEIELTGFNGAEITVNGKYAGTQIWKNAQHDLRDYLKEGKNKVELKIVNNLHNLLGPHHLKAGESTAVGPHLFFKGSNIWYPPTSEEDWTDGYTIVNQSVGFR